jgi:hypothetical protein
MTWWRRVRPPALTDKKPAEKAARDHIHACKDPHGPHGDDEDND